MITKREWKKLYHEQIKIGACYCYLCGRQIETENDFSIDHILPTHRGGIDAPSNWGCCCRSCNSKKGSLTYDEYREWQRLEYLRNGGKIK